MALLHLPCAFQDAKVYLERLPHRQQLTCARWLRGESAHVSPCGARLPCPRILRRPQRRRCVRSRWAPRFCGRCLSRRLAARPGPHRLWALRHQVADPPRQRRLQNERTSRRRVDAVFLCRQLQHGVRRRRQIDDNSCCFRHLSPLAQIHHMCSSTYLVFREPLAKP